MGLRTECKALFWAKEMISITGRNHLRNRKYMKVIIPRIKRFLSSLSVERQRKFWIRVFDWKMISDGKRGNRDLFKLMKSGGSVKYKERDIVVGYDNMRAYFGIEDIKK